MTRKKLIAENERLKRNNKEWQDNYNDLWEMYSGALEEISKIKKNNNLMSEVIHGKRVAQPLCVACEHGVVIDDQGGKTYACDYDIMCNDFKRKTE